MAIVITLPEERLRFHYRELYSNKILVRDMAGVYLLYDRKGKLLYVGKSVNLRDRLLDHIKGVGNSSAFFRDIHEILVYFCDDPMEREIYETYLINKLKPVYNRSKVYHAEKITELEDRVYEIEEELNALRYEKLEIQSLLEEYDEEDDMYYDQTEALGEHLFLIRSLREIKRERRALIKERAKLLSQINS